MADDVVLARFGLDLERLKQDARDYLDALDKIQDETAQTGKAGKTASDQLAAQGKKRSAAIKGEADQLKKVGAASREAFNTKPVDNFTKEVNKSQAAIKRVGSEGNSVSQLLKKGFALVGGAITAAYAVDAVKQFAFASIDAFLEAESSATRLKFAITTIGGESEVAFDRLVKQSNDLQKAFGVSDESIQKAQASLSAFGLTAQQIEKTIPILNDFAVLTGKDITEAAQALGSGLEGVGKDFKKYEIEVSAAATRTENLNAILQGLSTYQGTAAAEAKTLTGELRRQAAAADELKESIGEQLAPTFVRLKQVALEAIQSVIDGFRGIEALRKEADKRSVDSLAERIEADLTAQAQVRGITLVEQATRELIEVEKQLGDTRSEINQIELNADVTKPATERLILLRKNNEELTRTEQVIKNIIQLETDRARVTTEQAAKEAAEKETEARKKSLEELKKLQEKERQELEKNIDLLAKLRVEGIDEEKQRRIAVYEDEIRTLTAQGQLRGAIMLEMENKLVNDLNEIDRKRNVDPLFRATPSSPAVPDQLPTATPNSADETLARLEDEREERVRFNDEIIAGSVQLIGQLNSLWGSYTNAQIDRINRETDAQLNALNLQEEAIDKQLQNRSISEREAEVKKEQLLRMQVEAEEKAAKKIREVKRKQAIMDKAAALIEITINTAQAVSKAAAQSGVLAPAFAALLAALGAAQAAIVVAQPIPYRRGTKSARGGLSLVDEEGSETIARTKGGRLTHLERGDKVVPVKQSNKYKKVVDAMIDDNMDSFIHQNFVVPKLMQMKRATQQRAGEDFATNITKSIQYNSMADPSVAVLLGRSGIKIRNVEELGREIARHSPRTDRYRR